MAEKPTVLERLSVRLLTDEGRRLPSQPDRLIAPPRLGWHVLTVLGWMPDMQDFNSVLLHAVGDNVRQSPMR